MAFPRFCALAACLAWGAAHAQSTVTVFGTLDARIAHGSGSVANTTRLSPSGTNSSRIGFRGSEDLGGGLEASFMMEGDVNNDTGTGAASSLNNQVGGAPAAPAGGQGLTFNRRSTLSLTGAWGELRLGRDYTATFWNVASADPFGNVGVGVTQMTSGHRAGPTFARSSNGIGYLLPANIGGWYGQVQHYLGENLGGTPSSRDGTGTGLRIGFSKGMYNLALATSHTSFAAGDIRSTNLLASVNLGKTQLNLGLAQDRVEGASPDGRAWLLGMNANWGPGQFRASLSDSKTDAAGNPGARKLAIGYVYPLSKRTALYGTVARLQNRGGATFGLNAATSGPDARSTGYDLGIRHFF